jgi:hypothetical protein
MFHNLKIRNILSQKTSGKPGFAVFLVEGQFYFCEAAIIDPQTAQHRENQI